jgi:hypothetical protein
MTFPLINELRTRAEATQPDKTRFTAGEMLGVINRLTNAEEFRAAVVDWLDKPHKDDRWETIINMLGPEWEDYENLGGRLVNAYEALSPFAHYGAYVKGDDEDKVVTGITVKDFRQAAETYGMKIEDDEETEKFYAAFYSYESLRFKGIYRSVEAAANALYPNKTNIDIRASNIKANAWLVYDGSNAFGFIRLVKVEG